MAAATVIAYLWSQLQPNAALFYLMSPNTALNIGLLCLSIIMVRLSFINRFKTRSAYGLTVAGAISALSIAAIGALSTIYNFTFLGLLGPIDFLLIGELGIYLSICALSYEHQPLRLKALAFTNLARLPRPRLNTGLPRLSLHQLRHSVSAK